MKKLVIFSGVTIGVLTSALVILGYWHWSNLEAFTSDIADLKEELRSVRVNVITTDTSLGRLQSEFDQLRELRTNPEIGAGNVVWYRDGEKINLVEYVNNPEIRAEDVVWSYDGERINLLEYVRDPEVRAENVVLFSPDGEEVNLIEYINDPKIGAENVVLVLDGKEVNLIEYINEYLR